MRVVGHFPFRCVCVAALLASAVNVRAGDWVFSGIGDAPGGGFSSGAFGVSADGETVVGSSIGEDGSAVGVFWSWGSGLQTIGHLFEGGYATVVRACSDDGTVLIGESSERAFRWTKFDGFKDIGTFTPDSKGFSSAFDITGDGEVVVGRAQTKNGADAFRWRAGASMSNDGYTAAMAVSADASAIAVTQVLSGSQKGWLVRDGQEPVDLGDLPGGTAFTQPTAMGTDAQVVVGFSRSRNGVGGASGTNEAFIWRESTGMVGLGNFENNGFSQSQALGVSNDGGIVVGFGSRGFSQDAAIWIDGGPIQRLKVFLLGLGIEEVSDWTLTSATAVSPDGRTIVGTGVNPEGFTEGWVVRIPVPGGCAVMALAAVFAARRRR